MNLRTLLTVAISTVITVSCGQIKSPKSTTQNSISPTECAQDNGGSCFISQITKSALDPDLVAANIVAGVSIFGVVGSATGSVAACSAPGLVGSNCTASPASFWTNISGTNVNGANGALSFTIPAGYYTGSELATASDSNLIASNVRSGTSIFGTTGSLIPAYTGCVDDSLNSGQCSTTANRYVTASAGSDVTAWSNGAASTTVVGALPNAYYSGRSCSFTDADLAAGNILSGVNIFGVAGTATAAHAACTDDALNVSACSTATNRYVTATSGSNVTSWTNGSGTSVVSGTIPAGYYSGRTCQFSDANLSAANIRLGATIFGVNGSYIAATAFGGAVASGVHRSSGTLTVSDEAATYAGSSLPAGFREIPSISTDFENTNPTPLVRTGWAGLTCGTAQSTIAARISDCGNVLGPAAASITWNPSTSYLNSAYGTWTLVVRSGDCVSADGSGSPQSLLCKEVWRDNRTGLLWSSRVGIGSNWCQASGANNSSAVTNPSLQQTDPAGICTGANYQKTATAPISLCFENSEFVSDDTTEAAATFDGKFGRNQSGKGGLGLSSSPLVRWRLPSRADYQTAIYNGLNFVLPDLGNPSTGGAIEWTATIDAASAGTNYSTAFRFTLNSNGTTSISQTTSRGTGTDTLANTNAVNSIATRCVGR